MSTAILPDPQLIADASSLAIFSSAISQSIVKLVNELDPSSSEYAGMKAYFKENLPKLKAIVERLEADLA